MARDRSALSRVPWVSLGSLALVVPVATADTRSASERAEEWVQTHAAQMPTSFDRFVEYPLEYQRAIFSALSPADKTAVMIGKLRHVLTSEGGLSARQTAVLERAIAAVRKYGYRSDAGESARAELTAACQEYGAVATGRFIGALEPLLQPAALGWNTSFSAMTVRIREAVNNIGSMSAAPCDCATDTWCPGCFIGGGGCGPGMGGIVCTSVSSGCGCFWDYPCDGLCLE